MSVKAVLMVFAHHVCKVGGKNNPKHVSSSVKMVYILTTILADFKQVKRSNTYNAVIGLLKTNCRYCQQ